MIKKELFDKTVSILVKAYRNDTLRHIDCTACAVGNMVSANIGKPLKESILPGEYATKPYWFGPLHHNFNKPRHIVYSQINENVNYQVKATGYSIEELSLIEYAFESAEYGNTIEDWVFNGLMSVIDCLMQIHQATELEATEAKSLFVKV